MIELVEDVPQGIPLEAHREGLDCEYFDPVHERAPGCRSVGHYLCRQQCASYEPEPEDDDG